MLRFANRNLATMAVSDMLGNLVRTMVFPYVSLYVLALGGQAEQIGLIGLLTQTAGLFLLPLAGRVADRFNRVHIVVMTGYFALLFQFLNVFARDWRWLATAATLVGFVVISFPAYSSLVADSLHEHGRGRGIALMSMVSTSLMIAAPYIAGKFIDDMGTIPAMRFMYATLIALYFLGTTVQLIFLRETDPTRHARFNLGEIKDEWIDALRKIPALIREMPGELRTLWAIIVLAFTAQALTGNFLVVYATTTQALSAGQWGFILLIESLLRWLLLIPAGTLVDRLGRRRTMVFALVLFALSNQAFLYMRGFEMVLAIRLVQAIAFTIAFPSAMALMADLTPPSARGKMMAALGNGGVMLGGVGGPGGPAVGYLIIPFVMTASYAGGVLYALSPVISWSLASACGLAAAFLTLRGIQPRLRSRAPQTEGGINEPAR